MPAATPWMDFVHDPAEASLKRIRETIGGRLGLRYLDLAPGPVGLGLGVAFGETDFVVASVNGAGNRHHVALTCGVLRDVRRDRLLVFNECNRLTQDRPAYPFYLHDADIGWDILMETSFPVDLLVETPEFLRTLLIGLPQVAEEGRERLLEGNVGGVAYRWEPADLQRLLYRSLM